MNTQKETYDIIESFIQNTASERLPRKSATTVHRSEPNDTSIDLSYEHWISSIIVASNAVKIQFVVHYTPEAASWFRCGDSSLTADNVRLAHDHIREFCNLTAGAIKRGLQNLCTTENKPIELMVTLPDQEPSSEFVADYTLAKEKENQHCHVFKIHCDDFALVCASTINILDWNTANEISEDNIELPPADEFDIEFL